MIILSRTTVFFVICMLVDRLRFILAKREITELRELLKQMEKIQNGVQEINRKIEILEKKKEAEYEFAKSEVEDMLSSEVSAPKSRVRREVKSLVEIELANSVNLRKLVGSVDILVNSTISREILDPFFVSTFILLSDIALSTSPRIDKHREEIEKLVNYFRENIMVQSDVDMFEDKMADVMNWYTGMSSAEFESCADVLSKGRTQSGLYTIVNHAITTSLSNVTMYCDQETEGGGWTVVLRRKDGSQNFDKTWTEFKTGFGNKSSEFWIGNEILHAMTSSEPHELRVDLTDFDGNAAHATYSFFAVASEEDCYRLSFSGYSGDAGDAMAHKAFNNNGQCFSTKESDRDSSSSANCAARFKGAWWWNSCGYANLNGLYFDHKQASVTGISWFLWKTRWGNIKRVEMKLRPNK